MIKIAISRKANSGKNTVAKLLEKNLKIKANTLAFADPIKEIILSTFPSSNRSDLFGASELRDKIVPGLSVSYRYLLQKIGTSFKEFDNNVWINNLDSKLLLSTSDLVIVSDLRFINEYDYLKKNNFLLIRINRKCYNNIKHESEVEQEKIPDSSFNYVLNNYYNLDYLEHKIKDIIKNISTE